MGSQIAIPINGAADWSDFVDFTQRIARGYHGVSLTNYENDSEPQVAAGSGVEVGGAFYEFTALESITGWGAISNDTVAYIKVVPAGAAITVEFVAAAPTWSTSKQGWYVGNDRYLFDLSRGASSGVYSSKRALLPWGARGNLTGNLTGLKIPVGFVHGDSVAEDTLYEAMSADLGSVVGSKMLVSGYFKGGIIDLICSYAERTTASQIRVFGVDYAAAASAAFDVDDNGGGTFPEISLAW